MPPEIESFALDEDAFRKIIEEKAPEVFTSDPEEANRVVESAPAATTEPVQPEPEKSPEEQAPTLEADILAATEQKTADEQAAKAAEDTAKAAATAEPPKPVHEDLEAEIKKLDPHTKPKTRKIIDTFKEKAIAERDRATKAEQRINELQKQYEEAVAASKSTKPSKEVEDEITALRERVRELDVTKDPVIERKYDKPIAANTDAAIAMLGEYGLFNVRVKNTEGKEEIRPMTDKEKAQMTANIKAGGISLRTMAQNIKALEAAGDVEGAEQLREYARENDRLNREKANEIQSIKGDIEGRQQARTREQQEAQQQIQSIAAKTSQEVINADLAELAKVFPQITRPADPLPTDSAAVVAAKKAAQAEFDLASKQVGEASKQFDRNGLPPDKAAQAEGRMIAHAVQAVILKNHVLPRMAKDLSEREAKIKELQSTIDGFRKAGTLNRAHAASITSGTKQGPDVPVNASFSDAFAAQMKAAGVDVNS